MNLRPLKSRVWAGVLSLLVMCVLSLAAHAHDIGVMTVSALVTADRSVRVDLVFDSEHLPAALIPLGKSGALAADDPVLVEHLRALVLKEAKLRAGSEMVALHGVSGVGEASATGGVPSRKIRFSLVGELPAGAERVSWSSELPVGQYLFRFGRAGVEETVNQWLEPGIASRDFAIDGDAEISGDDADAQRSKETVNAAEAGKDAGAGLDRSGVVLDYLKLGYTHILPGGLDHILFVLGLFFLSRGIRPLLAQVTAFTVAHSITLGLAACGVVRLPPSVVEPLIAASIVFVAIENIFAKRCTPWRTAVVFCFGLLHGMGFAGVLQELGLPRGEFFPALISFNVGVEFGQLTVIGAAFLAIGLWHGAKPWYRARVAIPASALIALTGIYWTVERIAAS